MMSLTVSAQTSIYTSDNSAPVMFGIREIEKALQKKDKTNKLTIQKDARNADIILSLETEPKFVEGGFKIEREFAYPQFGITALRLLASVIDRARGTDTGAVPPDSRNRASAAPAGAARRAMRLALWLVRSVLLALAWPLDRLLRLQVPQRYRYYRLWVLSKSAGGR